MQNGLRVISQNSNLDTNKSDIESGDWTPTFSRDTATNMYAKWVRIGLIMFINAQWTNVHTSGTGASMLNVNSIPKPTGYTFNYGFHGSWYSYESDKMGVCGQYHEDSTFRFEVNGVGGVLPDEKISFNAICFLRKT